MIKQPCSCRAKAANTKKPSLPPKVMKAQRRLHNRGSTLLRPDSLRANTACAAAREADVSTPASLLSLITKGSDSHNSTCRQIGSGYSSQAHFRMALPDGSHLTRPLLGHGPSVLFLFLATFAIYPLCLLYAHLLYFYFTISSAFTQPAAGAPVRGHGPTGKATAPGRVHAPVR